MRNMRSILITGAAVGAAAIGGGAIANAATSTTSSSSSATSGTMPQFRGPAHGTAAHEDAEKAVTGTAAAKAQTAAVRAVGGGTAGAVATDCTQTGYEVTVTKSNGTKVEVHLNSSFQVMHGPGGHGGPPGMGASGTGASGA